MIGIDISDDSIKVVQTVRRRGNRRLQAFGWGHMPAKAMQNGVIHDAAAVRAAVVETLRSCRLPVRRKEVVVASISEAQSFLRVVEVPIMEEDEAAEAIKWEVAQHIPFGLENVYLDWQPINGGGHESEGHMEVLVGASQKKVVDAIYEVIGGLGWDVAALELESQAVIRALVSHQLQRKQGLLIVDLGGSSTNVAVYDHGALRFTASLQKGIRDFLADLPQAEAEILRGRPVEMRFNNKESVEGKLRPHQEQLVTEIRGIVEFYNSIDVQHQVREIILTGGGSNLPGFDKVFVKFFDNVHIQRGNPWVNLMQSGKEARLPMNLQESMHYTTAIGLSLREVVV